MQLPLYGWRLFRNDAAFPVTVVVVVLLATRAAAAVVVVVVT